MPDEELWKDLGSGVSWSWIVDSKEVRVGGHVRHPAADGKGIDGFCIGAVTFRGPSAWNLVKQEPLTMEPSILCSCGFHGWIRDGQWVSA